MEKASSRRCLLRAGFFFLIIILQNDTATLQGLNMTFDDLACSDSVRLILILYANRIFIISTAYPI